MIEKNSSVFTFVMSYDDAYIMKILLSTTVQRANKNVTLLTVKFECCESGKRNNHMPKKSPKCFMFPRKHPRKIQLSLQNGHHRIVETTE